MNTETDDFEVSYEEFALKVIKAIDNIDVSIAYLSQPGIFDASLYNLGVLNGMIGAREIMTGQKSALVSPPEELVNPEYAGVKYATKTKH